MPIAMFEQITLSYARSYSLSAAVFLSVLKVIFSLSNDIDSQ